MIPVETVIRKLIVEYEFVVLPGFGALLSHQVPVSFDMDAGIFSPPVKKLAFNEFLKLDDGLLANYISRHEQISHLEAVVYVKRYIDRLRAMLQSRGAAKIDGIGQFSSNIEGKLVFDPNTERHFKDEWYGFGNVNASLCQTNGLTLRPDLAKHAVAEHVEIVEEGAEKEVSISWWRWSAAAMLVGLVAYFSLFFVSVNSENKSTLNPFAGLFESKSETALVKTDKVNTPEAVVKSVPLEASDSLSKGSDSGIVDLPVGPIATVNSVSEKVVESNAAIITEGKFFVIAGAFKGNKQANVLLGQLRKKGFEDALLLPADQYNNRVKVAVRSYVFETDAYAASKRLKDVIGEIGWVYEKK